MVHHLVFFRMTPEGDARELVLRLSALRKEIAELVRLEVGTDISKSDASWDVGLYTVFATKEDLEKYRIHPKHQEVVAWLKENTAERAVVDFEG